MIGFILGIILWPFLRCIQLFRDLNYKFKEDKNLLWAIGMVPYLIAVSSIGIMIFRIVQHAVNHGYGDQLARIKEYGFMDSINHSREILVPGASLILYKPASIIAVVVLAVITIAAAIVIFMRSETKGKKIILMTMLVIGVIICIVPFILQLITYYGHQHFNTTFYDSLAHWVKNTFFEGQDATMPYDVVRQYVINATGIVGAVSVLVMIILLRWSDNSQKITSDLVYSVVLYFMIVPALSWFIVNIVGLSVYAVVGVIAIVGAIVATFALGGALSAESSGSSGGGGSVSSENAKQIERLERQNAEYAKNTREHYKGTLGYGHIDPKVTSREIEKNNAKIAELRKQSKKD